MRNTIWQATNLVAWLLCSLGANAEEAGCNATPENGKYQLEKASGDSVQALKDWLHYCPNENMMSKYALEIEKAKAGTNNKQPSSPPVTATPAAKPKSKSEPYGTYAQHGSYNFDKQAGRYEWDDILVIRPDGSEMRTKLKYILNSGWTLAGCTQGERAGRALITQKFTNSISSDEVALNRYGSIEVTAVEPSCWKIPQELLDDVFGTTGPSFYWVGGRLKNNDGEYYRQD